MKTTPVTISQRDLERLKHHLYFDTVRALPRCGMLREELVRANVVEPEEIGAEIVTMNSTVRFVDEQAGKQYGLTLVYADQAGNPGTVSIFAPVGSALLGLAVGQTIEWQFPGGRQLRLRVDSIVNQPEAQQQFHR